MEEIVYRKATINDLDQILKLGNLIADFDENELSNEFWDFDILRNCIENEESGYITCSYKGEELTGFIITMYNCVFKRAIITNTIVLPKYRNMGIGKKLLELALEDMSKKDINCITTSTQYNNTSIISFFESQKFDKEINNVTLFLEK